MCLCSCFTLYIPFSTLLFIAIYYLFPGNIQLILIEFIMFLAKPAGQYQVYHATNDKFNITFIQTFILRNSLYSFRIISLISSNSITSY